LKPDWIADNVAKPPGLLRTTGKNLCDLDHSAIGRILARGERRQAAGAIAQPVDIKRLGFRRNPLSEFRHGAKLPLLAEKMPRQCHTGANFSFVVLLRRLVSTKSWTYG
jgi:hypothetical protein